MDAFEQIAKLMLETKGYWVRQSVKVEISKEDKVKLGKPSLPRPEIDLVAFGPRKDELLLVEAKSLFDSYGVYYEAVCTSKDELSERYKLFTDSEFRETVTRVLRKQYLSEGLIAESTAFRYALVAGHIHNENERKWIKEYFEAEGRNWILFTIGDIRDTLMSLSGRGWEDNPIIQTAKVLLREGT